MNVLSVPEGCLTLMQACQYYLGALLPEAFPTETQQEEVQSELIAAFQSQAVEVLYRRPSSDAIDAFPPSSWEADEWLERIFLSPAIQSTSAWAPYNGVVPFVRKESFLQWVDKRKAERAERHAHLVPNWSFVQAIIWIMGQNDAGASMLWSCSTAALMLESEVSGFKDARDRLVLALADLNTSLIATGRRNLGERVEIKPIEWSDLKLETEPIEKDLAFCARRTELNQNTGVMEPVTFHSLLVPRDSVMRLWPCLSDQMGEEAAALASSTTESSASRPASVATIKKAIMLCVTFATEHGIIAPNQSEFETILGAVYEGTTRQKIRQVFKAPEVLPLLPQKQGPRGARNPNRDNEIAQFRRFLSAAELRN